MKRIILMGFIGLLFLNGINAQVSETVPNGINPTYRATATKVNDLVNTRLDVSFDYSKRYLYGKEWVTLKPQFYPTDSLVLDAKGMDIKIVALVGDKNQTPLKYSYDEEFLHIGLDREYNRNEKYTIYIEYTAKPDELKTKGSAAIIDAKGLYFINPDGSEKDKPIQVWTQGETESNSAWFPTIDKPNQKTTQEISMTVPSKYTTLSNGKLILQKKNADGTRTDIWKMDKPHAPYLFMMAIGDFKIYKDTPWKGKEVSYYLEPKYAPYAKQIFGKTPEMISFYSKTLGVDYPWNKYSQVVVRDYVSGAMENTTATLHGEHVQKTTRELLDDNEEGTIAHELFHQWFGDLVTAESWSNISMNESFATFGEIIWEGHDKGKDAEDKARYDKLMSYIGTTNNGKSPALARYYYNDKEDVFDNVSYPKGSVILYALKNKLGDDAFYRGLQNYLTTNAYKTGEPQQLRLALEEVSGRDLSQYFNQWWYYGGHPILDITYGYDNSKATIHIKQVQDSTVQTFILPVNINYYVGDKKISKKIVINQRDQNFEFDIPSKPDFIDFDVYKIIVGEVHENKSIDDYVYQYKNVPSYANRVNALKFAAGDKSNKAQELLLSGLKDISDDLRTRSVGALNLEMPEVKSVALPLILTIAKTDKNTTTKAAAINKLASTGDIQYKPLMLEALLNPSYNVLAAGITGLTKLDPDAGSEALLKLDVDTKQHIQPALFQFYAADAKDTYQPIFQKALETASSPQEVFKIIGPYISYLAKNINPTITENGVQNLTDIAKRLHLESVFAGYVAPSYLKIAEQKQQQSQNADAIQKDNLLKQADVFKNAAETFK